MSMENMIVLGGVVAAFAFFSAIIIFGDLTWKRGTVDDGHRKR